MIYLVSKQLDLFETDTYERLGIRDSLDMMESWNVIQFDSETSGRDPHLCKMLCAQFGNDKADAQIVVDTTTIDLLKYKNLLESKLVIGHNLKFDLQFLYNYGIIPRRVYDTMIVEQFLYLGYPASEKKYGLKDVAYHYLDINIDKTVRGEIIWRGLDESVIRYAAGDVMYLEKIAAKQMQVVKRRNAVAGAKLECDTVPAMAYLEWCGVHLDQDKWKKKMEKDMEALEKAKADLDQWVIKSAGKIPHGQRNIYKEGLFGEKVKVYEKLQDFVFINPQGNLWTGFDLTPKVKVNWSSSRQVVKIAQILGFDTKMQDKKTGEDKDSVLEKHLALQKGINDEFLNLYFNYQEAAKVVSSFGQGHLNAVNPKTGRIHTNYKQLGAASGRMSCGSQKPNEDLAKYKGIAPSKCTYPNLQQLPHDEMTRSCFTAMPGNLFISCDYSAQEGRVQGDIYQDKAILKMYREGIDGHSMYAKIFFKDQLKDIDVHDVKKLRPDLRSKAKSPEFALAYGGGYTTIMQQLKCSEEEAKTIVRNYEEGFKGTAEFARKGSAFVRKNGYILICKQTGHRMYWWDHDVWLERQNSFTREFWEEYKKHKGTGDRIATMVSKHFRAASKYDRLARNAPPQGTSACMTKEAVTNIFNWIVDNGYFGKILCCVLVHDETNWEYPKEVEEFPKIVQTKMEEAAKKYCKLIDIPAEASVGDHWIH